MKELAWTVCFHFPFGDVYPTTEGLWTDEMSPKVRDWDNEAEAKDFAVKHSYKYGWDLVPTLIETKTY